MCVSNIYDRRVTLKKFNIYHLSRARYSHMLLQNVKVTIFTQVQNTAFSEYIFFNFINLFLTGPHLFMLQFNTFLYKKLTVFYL